MATIYDVARQAGVSPKTVSRVLNGDAPVGNSTRDKVESAIAVLGYVPSKAARMMRSNRSGLVGLITGAISQNPEANEPHGLPDLFILQGIQQVITDAGKTLLIADTGGAIGKVPDLIRTFSEHRVEGLIYVADYHQKVALDVQGIGCPLLLANCYNSTGTPAVLPDDRACQRNLVEKIIQSGHRRIGYLTLDSAMRAAIERTAGYRDALKANGIKFDPALVTMGYDAGSERESKILMASLQRLLELPEPPTVICCGNDEMALRVYGLLRTRGLKVPEEISVAGFDNYRTIAETLVPPLTTVELPYLAMGRQAAEELLAMIGGEPSKTTGPTLVSGPVIWRSSVTSSNSVSHLPLGRNIS